MVELSQVFSRVLPGRHFQPCCCHAVQAWFCVPHWGHVPMRRLMRSPVPWAPNWKFATNPCNAVAACCGRSAPSWPHQAFRSLNSNCLICPTSNLHWVPEGQEPPSGLPLFPDQEANPPMSIEMSMYLGPGWEEIWGVAARALCQLSVDTQADTSLPWDSQVYGLWWIKMNQIESEIFQDDLQNPRTYFKHLQVETWVAKGLSRFQIWGHQRPAPKTSIA